MKTVLITGSTSGIGAAFSKLFASKGYHLILVSRNPNKLHAQQEKLQGRNNRIDIVAYDLVQPNAAERIYQIAKQNGWHIDVLVNNASFNEAGAFTQTDRAKEQAMIDLHIRFVTDMMKLFIPDMVKHGDGRILNVGSTGSYMACPNNAIYAATKAYVLYVSRAVNSELKRTGVSVTALCPGSTRTEFAKKADMENTLLFRLFVMSPQNVAKIGYRAMSKRKAVVIPGLYNKLLVFSSRILPYFLINWVTKKMLRQNKARHAQGGGVL